MESQLSREYNKASRLALLFTKNLYEYSYAGQFQAPITLFHSQHQKEKATITKCSNLTIVAELGQMDITSASGAAQNLKIHSVYPNLTHREQDMPFLHSLLLNSHGAVTVLPFFFLFLIFLVSVFFTSMHSHLFHFL